MINMIPKRMFFYWNGSKLSWMRYMTLFSFKVLNPNWDVILYITDDNNVFNKTWTQSESQDFHNYNGKDYFSEVEKLNIKVEKLILPEDITNAFSNMSPIHKSDLFRYYELYTNGGFYCDMDVLFFKSMDSFYNEIVNNNYDTVIQESLSTQNPNQWWITIGFLASTKDNKYYKDLFDKGINNYNPNDYQSMGAHLIYDLLKCNRFDKTFDLLIKTYPNLKFYNLPTHTIYYYDWTKVQYCYSNPLYINTFDKKSIGYHWFGGNPISQQFNNILNENNYTNYNITFSKIAKEVLKKK